MIITIDTDPWSYTFLGKERKAVATLALRDFFYYEVPPICLHAIVPEWRKENREFILELSKT